MRRGKFRVVPLGSRDYYHDPTEEENVQWRKVLYDTTNKFADNYTPRAYFLDAIVRNKNLHKYKFDECFQGACQVAAQTCFVQMLVLGYFAMDGGFLSSSDLLLVAAIVCFFSYSILTSNKRPLWLLNSAKRVLFFVVLGLGFSPVLQKLTSTISTDSIYTMTSFMLLVHLIFHDYGSAASPMVSNELSLNAGLFATVCLASRLPQSFDGFVLMSLAVEVLILLPSVRRRIKGTVENLAVTSIISLVVIWASYVVISFTASALVAIGLFGVAVICPILFFHWQSYKDTIHGPWDEAVPKSYD